MLSTRRSRSGVGGDRLAPMQRLGPAAAVMLALLQPLGLGQAKRVSYPIVCVRAPREGDRRLTLRTEVRDPGQAQPGTDLVILHPKGREEVLVAGGEHGAVIDPYVSFDGEWVFYSRFHDLRQVVRRVPSGGSDIYKIHVGTRKVVRLTHQEWTPNKGANPRGKNPGVLNLGPCPLPGGRVIFTSSRNGFAPAKGFTAPNLQMFVMDDDGKNVECVGHFNLGSAMHPVVLMDGRVIFSSYEAQGLRDERVWGIWIMNPDGRDWGPVVSAFWPANAMHFQTQTTDGQIVFTNYYNRSNNGYGAVFGVPVEAVGQFEPGARERWNYRPKGVRALTPFATMGDRAARKDSDGSYMGKVTDPAGAPDGDLLLSWTDGPANNVRRPRRPVWKGMIVRMKADERVEHPREFDIIKADPGFNYFQPHALVPYKAIYGIEEPRELPWRPNAGQPEPRLPHLARELPAGTPFGLVGSASLINRNTKPRGTRWGAEYEGWDAFNDEDPFSTNWFTQGADAGKYGDDDIWAVRVISMEVPNDRRSLRALGGFHNWSNERLRILGEFPVRKRDANDRPIRDPDGNQDTSFLVKIPADVPFTFQTLDKNGMVLNMSQTWHQVRPGEARMNCGGCHAHLNEPTPFFEVAAAKPGYRIRDLARTTPLLDSKGGEAVREAPVLDVEYVRDVQPILQKGCLPCHSTRNEGGPAAKLDLDDDRNLRRIYRVGRVPGTYYRLCADERAEFGHKSVHDRRRWFFPNASRYVRKFQSRRSLLIWKVFGKRLDGWSNDDHPTARTPTDSTTLHRGGKKVEDTERNRRLADLDFVAGGCKAHEIGDDERQTLVRWIDLGAPLTLPDPARKRYGHLLDNQRPTLAVTRVEGGFVIGAYDAYLDASSLRVRVDGRLASASAMPDNRWFVAAASAERVRAEVKDRLGNVTVVDRRFVGGAR